MADGILIFSTLATPHEYGSGFMKGCGEQLRSIEGRDVEPTAGILDSQTVKTTEKGGVKGYDAGKKINGRKRHIIVDTMGLMRDGCRTCGKYPRP